jgi:valyl-tRNA synthetase
VVDDPIDRSMLAKLDAAVAEATDAFEGFDYARALERTEEFFWWFCDNYVELVKGRAYESRGAEAAASARGALREALSTVQRLFAPLLPFASEEVWSWWQSGSIHRAAWPQPSGLGGDAALIEPVIEVLTRVRRAKTEAKQSQRSSVAHLEIAAPTAQQAYLAAGRADLLDAGSIESITITDGAASMAGPACTIELATADV